MHHYAYLGTLESFIKESEIIKKKENSAIIQAIKHKKSDSVEDEKNNLSEEKEPMLSAEKLQESQSDSSADNKSLKPSLMEEIPTESSMLNNQLIIKRGVIRKMLMNGNYEDVEGYIKENFPDLWNSDRSIQLSLWALRFIEIINSGDIKKAIEYSSEYFADNNDNETIIVRDLDGYEKQMKVDELFGLLCYDKINESPLKYLLSPMQRETVSDYINNKIMSLKNLNESTGLEESLKHLVAVQNYQLEMQNSQPNFKLKI